ncbi:PaaI family thioesterase [Pelagibaculum spongiae]|uniref:Thioesterase n=1 Tax=Pelagibaculum spongiae TaxID=2080658 RepID=A0A2V1GZC0_9GAMM|nr:PaaI family thioesterase [Pelagibaculum spongiae]PVZ68153.1 thioesterase [Pelagibaculum spongiae]
MSEVPQKRLSKQTEHYQSLESMYLSAPVNQIYLPKITVSEAQAVIEIEVDPKLFHSAGAVHGSVYFKMLDDAAFFAANSLEPELFVLTTSFTTYITRPISNGKMRSVGKVVNMNRSQWIVEAVVYDGQDREIGRGNGLFVRSKQLLNQVPGYSAE